MRILALALLTVPLVACPPPPGRVCEPRPNPCPVCTVQPPHDCGCWVWNGRVWKLVECGR